MASPFRCVILAAGLGKRLWPLTARHPKPLAPVANEPLLAYALAAARHAGPASIHINTHHHADALAAWVDEWSRVNGVAVDLRREETLREPAGSLWTFADVVDQPVLVMSGDAFHTFDLEAFVERHSATGALLSVLATEVPDGSLYGVLELDDRGWVVSCVEKPQGAGRSTVSCGIYCVEPTVMDMIPDDRPYDFGQHLIPALAGRGLARADLADGYWTDIGTWSQLRAANLAAVSGDLDLPLNLRLRHADALINPTARIIGPVAIGNGARIARDATVYGPAVIGARANLGEGAVVDRSVLLPDVAVPAGGVVVDGVLAYTPARDAPIRQSTDP